MKHTNLFRFIAGAFAALLLSAGFAQAAERLDGAVNEFAKGDGFTVKSDMPSPPLFPCMGTDEP